MGIFYMYREKAEGKHLFVYLKQLGVKIRLDTESEERALCESGSFAKRFNTRYQHYILGSIAASILSDLLLSREIDEGIIEEIIQCYPNLPPAVEEERESKHDNNSLFLLGKFMIGLQDVWEEPEEVAEEMDGDDFLYGEDCEECTNEAKAKVAANKAKAAIPTPQDMDELVNRCKDVGYKLKQGQEQEILSHIISFLNQSKHATSFSPYEGSRRLCIQSFMQTVQQYMERTCVLEDLDPVLRAISSLDSDLKQSNSMKFLRDSEEDSDWETECHTHNG